MMSEERRELEGRIDHALAVARSSERAALEIGAAAFDAADQARRAADLAVSLSSAGTREPDSPLRHFTERADRVVARLRALDRLPAASSAS
jgi:hypothetical protein